MPARGVLFAVVQVKVGDGLLEEVSVGVLDVVEVRRVAGLHVLVTLVRHGDGNEVRAELEVFVHRVVDEPTALRSQLHGLVNHAAQGDELLGLGFFRPREAQ